MGTKPKRISSRNTVNINTLDKWNYNEKKNCDGETVTPINHHTTVTL